MRKEEKYTVKEYHEKTGLPVRTIQRWIHSGKIPGYIRHESVGGTFLIYVKPSNK